MTMNSSGAISLGGAVAGQSINLENGFSATAQVSLNDTAVRNLAGVASGAITMPTNFYGKSNRASISYTFSANTANASLNLSTISGYVAGKSDITVTINAGVYLYATSTGGYGLNLSGGTSGDTLTIVNNGYIMGQGGDGRYCVNPTSAQTAGGNALNLGFAMTSCTINNTNASAYIGGGGGGGNATNFQSNVGGGGGGAGGGRGGGADGNGGNTGWASGGSIGNTGANGVTCQISTKSGFLYYSGGGGGGRIFAGVGGSPNGGGGGAGGAGGGSAGLADGGAGGSANSAGASASRAGGGGGWGASGGAGYDGAGASGGKAVNLNGKSVTWTSGNTTRVYGAVS